MTDERKHDNNEVTFLKFEIDHIPRYSVKQGESYCTSHNNTKCTSCTYMTVHVRMYMTVAFVEKTHYTRPTLPPK